MNSTATTRSVQPTTSWGYRMKDRFFWGMPTTDTDTNAAEAALRDRAHDMAAGKYAAATFAQEALDRVTQRSGLLLVANVLFLMVVMWLMSRTPAEPASMLATLGPWSFGFALVGGLLLLSNLRLVWGSQAAQAYGDPHGAFVFAMNIYKGRAWRYTIAHLLSFAAFVLLLVAMSPFK